MHVISCGKDAQSRLPPSVSSSLCRVAQSCIQTKYHVGIDCTYHTIPIPASVFRFPFSFFVVFSVSILWALLVIVGFVQFWKTHPCHTLWNDWSPKVFWIESFRSNVHLQPSNARRRLKLLTPRCMWRLKQEKVNVRLDAMPWQSERVLPLLPSFVIYGIIGMQWRDLCVSLRHKLIHPLH